MSVTFRSGNVSGRIEAPPSKSYMQRAIVASLLCEGESVILNPSWCNDSVAALAIAESLGAQVSRDSDRVTIRGGLRPAGTTLNCGESGLALRMFSAVAAMTGKSLILTGEGSLRKRPVNMIENPLTTLGASVTTKEGFLPIMVEGPLKGGVVEVDGSVSSQFLTGLLFALPLAEKDSIIKLSNASSKPYIDMTVALLADFGITVENRDYREFFIKGRQVYRRQTMKVEGDWSGASFFLVMGAVSGELTVGNLKSDSLQADRRVLDVLRQAGADIEVRPDEVTVRKAALQPFEFDISDCPDLAPPLAILAAACRGKSILTGTERLVVKESSRGENIKTNLEKMGAVVRVESGSIEIEGIGLLWHAATRSFNDHRMAMAMAAASVLSGEGVTVDETECINKSYPGFIDDFMASGGEVRGFQISD
jgi:3-phosphoshikimate 1-carboxyvinyltransferase